MTKNKQKIIQSEKESLPPQKKKKETEKTNVNRASETMNQYKKV